MVETNMVTRALTGVWARHPQRGGRRMDSSPSPRRRPIPSPLGMAGRGDQARRQRMATGATVDPVKPCAFIGCMMNAIPGLRTLGKAARVARISAVSCLAGAPGLLHALQAEDGDGERHDDRPHDQTGQTRIPVSEQARKVSSTGFPTSPTSARPDHVVAEPHHGSTRPHQLGDGSARFPLAKRERRGAPRREACRTAGTSEARPWRRRRRWPREPR